MGIIPCCLQQLGFKRTWYENTYFLDPVSKVKSTPHSSALLPNMTRKTSELMSFEKLPKQESLHTHQQRNRNVFVHPRLLRVFPAKPCSRQERRCPESCLPWQEMGTDPPRGATQSSCEQLIGHHWVDPGSAHCKKPLLTSKEQSKQRSAQQGKQENLHMNWWKREHPCQSPKAW